ncbi:MAG: PAS domain S-box protein, partial [Chloroflexi bacterium]|nr:PAS domain S-box protein [Chloroflexota bacterium]
MSISTSISTKGRQYRPPRKRRFLAQTAIVLGIPLIVAVLSLGDLMEIVPLFASLVASLSFHFFHEIHDLLAMAVALYAAYKYHSRLGVAAILVYLAAHIPYVIVRFPEDAPEILRILFVAFVALFGIWLINQLHRTGILVRQTQEHLQLQVERMPIGLIVWDTNFRVQSWNPAAESIFGFSCEEALEKHPYDLIVPKGAQPQVDDVWRRLLEGDMTARSINENTTKDGRTIICNWLNTPLRGDDGQVLGVLSMVQDITESKVAEEKIVHLTAVLRSIRNVNQLITREKDRESLIQQSCDLLVQRQGYERAWILLLDENRNRVTAVGTGFDEDTAAFLKQLETGNYPVCVMELLGQEQAFMAYDQPGRQHPGCVLADDHSSRGVFRCKLEYGGKLYGVFGVALPSGAVFDKEEQNLFLELCGDITFALANIESEEKLRATEIQYHALFTNMLEGFAYCRMLFADGQPRDFVYLDVNAKFEELTGLHDVIGKKVTEVIPGIRETNPELFDIYGRVSLTGKPEKLETYLPALDMWFSVSVYSPQKEHFIAVFDVITERKKMEETLRRSEENFRSSMDDSPLGIRIVNAEGETTYANRAILDLYGYDSLEELKKTPTKKRYTPKSYAEHQVRMEKRQQGEYVPSNYEITIVRKNGEVRYLEVFRKEVLWNGETQFQVLYHDVTSLKKMREQLMAQDRLASIGQLVSGVAHEINNPLTGVIGFSELLLKRELPDDVKADLKVVNDEAMRTARIVKNLLTFARKQPQGKEPVDINEQIQRVLELRDHEQKVNNIQVITRFASDLPQVMGNGSQLQQVFFNIVINAEFFMLEAHQKGSLTITTERVGDFVRCSFADDGLGIPRENVINLFTPFFTTKPVGKGTGLGLSICYGIIAEHGGRIYA